MVYSGTSCGLNDVLWAPRFGLPTVKQTLRALLAGYCQCDLDVGEQFLNFPLRTDLIRSGCQRSAFFESGRPRMGRRARARPLGALGEKLDGFEGFTVSQSAVAGSSQA
jgi:hypothetical protein